MELKILNWLIRFFDRLRSNIGTVVEELLFLKYEIEFGEREDDIYITTFMKSGTTWMQMIVYQMVTGGNTDFRHIYDVSPWLRNLAVSRGPLPAQLPSPRIIKTHDAYHKISKGKPGRFIYVVRNGIDVANSLWHHRCNYVNAALTFQQNFGISFQEEDDMNWFTFNSKWIENKYGHKILYVRYEDLHTNLDHEVQRIADFLQVPLTGEIAARIKERASFTFMKQHETKFGEQPPEEQHQMVYNQFIRSGKTNEGFSQISDEELRSYINSFSTKLPPSPLLAPYFSSAVAEGLRRQEAKA
jgi:hypothetical protein